MKRIIIFIFSITMLAASSCNNLDLAPEDYYGSGNFWSNTAQVEGFMLGLHTGLRNQNQSLFVLGEARGGTSMYGTSILDWALNWSSPLKDNDFTKDKTHVTNWNGFYGNILQVNVFIKNVEEGCRFLTDSERNYMLGQAYGLRAFYYFLLYRTFGGVPFVEEAEVIYNTVSGAQDLYRPRATPKEIMDFIKEDINKSDSYFGADYSFKATRSMWSKAATLMLKAEIYLWSAKVTTGNQTPAATDLQTAKDALTPLTGRFDLLSNFSDIFDYTKKGNDEIIFTIRFMDGEATNFGGEFLYRSDGIAGLVYTAEGRLIINDTLNIQMAGQSRHEFKFGLFESYDDYDSRKKATFMDLYKRDENQQVIRKGTLMKKGIGIINTNGIRVFVSDMPVYRYADALLLMAEVENKQGNDPSGYINQVRQRAYGSNYDEALHGYTDAGFAANELAILHERDKEFVWEGKRWFDVVRMQDANGRALVFSAAASYDSPPRPILDYATEAHKLLWPVDVNTLNNDPTLEQTPGY